MKAKHLAVLLLAGGAGLLGCAAKKAAQTGQPPQPASAGTAEPAKAKYLVSRGDSLWTIAGKPGVHGDPFQWPLIYRQNRDQIQDPDLIEVRQELDYKKAPSQQEIDEAIRLARETPPFVPHSRPRKSLPVKY